MMPIDRISLGVRSRKQHQRIPRGNGFSRVVVLPRAFVTNQFGQVGKYVVQMILDLIVAPDGLVVCVPRVNTKAIDLFPEENILHPGVTRRDLEKEVICHAALQLP